MANINNITAGLQGAGTFTSALAGRNKSDVGGVFQGLGNMAQSVPIPMAQAVGAGLSAAGGLMDAMFGYSFNEENIARFEDENTSQANNLFDANSFEELFGQKVNILDKIKKEDVGTEGWFSNAVTNKTNQLNNLRRRANEIAFINYGNSFDRIKNLNDIQTGIELLGKRAMAFGGPLHSYGADWDDGFTTIGAGGSHESSPLGGIPMGIAPDGEPNLVEEGEVIYNDYVFSDRLRVPKAVRSKYKLRGPIGMTFANAARGLQKYIEERPNNPIDKEGIDVMMQRLASEQEYVKSKKEERMLNRFKDGGSIHIKPSKRGTFTAAASKHNMGVQEFASKVLANPDNYSPTMVKKANFARNAAKWHALGGHLFALGDSLTKPIIPKSLPIIAQLPTSYYKLSTSLPTTLQTNTNQNYGLVVPTLRAPEAVTPAAATVNNSKLDLPNNSALRYAPVWGSALSTLLDITGATNKPDYSGPNSIRQTASRATNRVRNVVAPRVNQTLYLNPIDYSAERNALDRQLASTRRGILNASQGNAGTMIAGLLGANRQGNEALAALNQSIAQRQNERLERMATFNRGTEQTNAESILKSMAANQGADIKKADLLTEAALRSALLSNQIDTAASNTRSKNLSTFFTNLGNLGTDITNRGTMEWLYDSLGPEGLARALGSQSRKYGGKIKKRKHLTY